MSNFVAVTWKKAVLVGLMTGAFVGSGYSTPSEDEGQHIMHPPHHLFGKSHPTLKSMMLAYPSGFTPSKMAAAYNFDEVYSISQGEGQTIAIVTAYHYANLEADLSVFNSTFNLPSCSTSDGCLNIVFADGTQPPASTAWAYETVLDVEWAHAMAPKAKIMLVEASTASVDNMSNAVSVAVKNGATVVSMSWGGSEWYYEKNYDKFYNVPNVSFIAAAGDRGNLTNYPASSPYVLGIGGTTLATDPITNNYLGEVGWSLGGGGISRYEPIPDYQANFPIPNNSVGRRGTPDVAYDADALTGVAVFTTLSNSSGAWYMVGGTSIGAPQWSALIAIAQSVRGKPIANLPKLIYAVAKANPNVFQDVTAGINGRCGITCMASKGYDYVGGLGTPNVPALVQALATS